MNKLLKEQSDVAVPFFIARCVFVHVQVFLKYSPTLFSESFLSRLFFKEREFIFLSFFPFCRCIHISWNTEGRRTERSICSTCPGHQWWRSEASRSYCISCDSGTFEKQSGNLWRSRELSVFYKKSSGISSFRNRKTSQHITKIISRQPKPCQFKACLTLEMLKALLIEIEQNPDKCASICGKNCFLNTHIYIHSHITYIHIYTYAYIHLPMHMHIYTYTSHIYTHIYTHTYITHTYIHTFAYHTHTHIHWHTHTLTYAYTHICTNIYTHAHTLGPIIKVSKFQSFMLIVLLLWPTKSLGISLRPGSNHTHALWGAEAPCHQDLLTGRLNERIFGERTGEGTGRRGGLLRPSANWVQPSKWSQLEPQGAGSTYSTPAQSCDPQN